MWDAPALRKEALDSSLSLQQLLIWILVVPVFSVIKELRTRQKVSLFRDVFIRVRKELSAPPSLPCPCPQLPGLVWSLVGGTAPLLHKPLVPITAASSLCGEELSAGSHRPICNGPYLRTVLLKQMPVTLHTVTALHRLLR